MGATPDRAKQARIELLHAGYVAEWPGFDEVALRHDELVKVVSNPGARGNAGLGHALKQVVSFDARGNSPILPPGLCSK